MVAKVFAIYDIRAEVYGNLFTFAHVGEAVRAFKDLANDVNTRIAKHPGDYKLAELGEFDDVTGVIEACPVQFHGFASDYIERAPLEVLRGKA